MNITVNSLCLFSNNKKAKQNQKRRMNRNISRTRKICVQNISIRDNLGI